MRAFGDRHPLPAPPAVADHFVSDDRDQDVDG
jgi:hypothetical protein